MANSKSQKKESDKQKTSIINRYAARPTRTAVRKLRNTTSKEEALQMYPRVCSMVDKLAKKNVIHRNKAANLKAKMAAHVNSLA